MVAFVQRPAPHDRAGLAAFAADGSHLQAPGLDKSCRTRRPTHRQDPEQKLANSLGGPAPAPGEARRGSSDQWKTHARPPP